MSAACHHRRTTATATATGRSSHDPNARAPRHHLRDLAQREARGHRALQQRGAHAQGEETRGTEGISQHGLQHERVGTAIQSGHVRAQLVTQRLVRLPPRHPRE